MTVRILTGDCLASMATLAPESAQCCVTSPPYFGLRDYGMVDQIGLEATPEEYVAKMVAVFREVRRVLRKDGTLWLNIGDSYAANWSSRRPEGGGGLKPDTGRERIKKPPPGLKSKDLIGIPWMLAFALRADGWWLRSDIIWSKPNPMPESVTDRPTKAHEYVFLMTKAERYFYDAEAIAERGVGRETYFGSDRYSEGSGRNDSGQYDATTCATRNARTVWTINPSPFAEAHFATMPPALAEKCIRAGSKEGDTILDPFGGAGTTGLVAQRLNRDAVLCELNPEYVEIATDRIRGDQPLFASVTGGAR